MTLTPEQKAKQLVERFAPIMPNEDWKEKAKQCALLCVDEMIKDLLWTNVLITFDDPIKQVMNAKLQEYDQLKQEIEKL
jgi:hypothetical protein